MGVRKDTGSLPRWAALVAALVAACDARFVEPNPPALATETLDLSPGQKSEPVVVGAIVDLHIADAALCDATHARLAATVATAVGSARGVALPVRDVSPACAQDPLRSVPVEAIDADVRSAELAFAGDAVRAVLLYVNNVDLAIPFTVTQALEELRQRALRRGALPPRLYGIVLDPAAWFGFDVQLRWTHADDDATWRLIDARLAQDLPFQTRTDLVRIAPLASPSRALLVKVCAESGGARVEGCTIGVGPCSVGDATPYAIATFQPAVAIPRSAFVRASASVSFERCAGRCERYVEVNGTIARWTELAACLGGGA